MSTKARRAPITGRARVRCATALLVLAFAPAVRAVGLFKIDLIAGPALQADEQALGAFRRAAADWEAVISSPIKVNVYADLLPFQNPNIIGATGYGNENLNLDYDTVRDRMAARANRPGNGILAHLPTSAELKVNLPPGADATYMTGTIGILRANQKALGLIADPLTDRRRD
jgi:hypothetical protein